jgi:glycosyltransferase involved in cell wall biosynthesis
MARGAESTVVSLPEPGVAARHSQILPVPRHKRRYLIALPAAARRVSATSFVAPRALVQQLRELKRELGGEWGELVLVAASLRDADWAASGEALSLVDESREHIRFEAMHRHGCSHAEFAALLPQLLPRIARLVSQSDLVHAHVSGDLSRPIGAWFCGFAKAMDKRVVAVADGDRRRDSEMKFLSGRWSKRTYLTQRYVMDPLRVALSRAYVRHSDLMMFRQRQLLEDVASGAPNVRLAPDPRFAAEHVIDDAGVARKLGSLSDGERPLRVLYCGRLEADKGVDKMLAAVACAARRGANLRFDIMGSGPHAPELRQFAAELGIAHLIGWSARRQGNEYFSALREHDLLLACPLSEDSPRSAWDALASGVPLLAFDTPFYCDLAVHTKAVVLSTWPEIGSLSDKLLALSRDKRQLGPMVQSAVAAARENTGTSWLKRRVQWVKDLYQTGRKLLAPVALSSDFVADLVGSVTMVF